MVVHAQADRRAAALSRGQCRRIRARHLQGPRDHAQRSASADRGLPDRRLRHGRPCRLHLYPRRVHPRARAPAGGDRRGLRGQADRQEQCARLGLRPLRPPRRRRLYLRRGDGAAGKPGRQEGPAAAEAAVPGQCRPLWLPDHGATTWNRSRWCPTSCGAAPPGSPASAGPTTPAPSCSAFPATSSALATSKRRWAFRCANCWRSMPAACAAAGTICWRSFRAARRCRWCRRARPAATTCCMDFDGCAAHKSALGTAAVDRHGQVDRHRAGDGAHLLFLQARILRPVHALPRGHGLDVARA